MSTHATRWMPRIPHLAGAVAILAAASATQNVFALPDQLVQDTVASGFVRPVGLAFSPNGGMFVWEKAGRVLFVTPGGENRVLLDLTEEVTLHHGRGLLGLALDPQFAANGHLYLAYTVDHAYLIANENENGNVYPIGTPDQPRDTISRLVRYTVDDPADPAALTLASRLVLLGHWSTNRDPDTEALTPPHETDGIPTTAGSHLANSLRFAPDGTLLAAVGDGGIWFTAPDVGQPRAASQSSNTAESDGILPEKWQIGAFRAQMADSYNGKILRLDVSDAQSNGCRGAAGNPFYDEFDPSAPRSLVYAMGFRNPYQFAIQPGTGSTDPVDGDPGVLYVGDVGWNTWEELNVVTAGGQNFGWPVYEGMLLSPEVSGATYAGSQIANLDALNPLHNGTTCTQEYFYFTDLLVNDSVNPFSWPNPCDAGEQIPPALTAAHRRPAFAYRRTGPVTHLPIFSSNGVADVLGIGQPLPPGATGVPASGAPFAGRSIIVGEFYTADKLPPLYHGALFFGDHTDRWIRFARFDASGNVTEIGEFMGNGEAADPTAIHVHPVSGDLYYVAHFVGQVRRITTDCNANGVADDIDLQSIGADCNQTGVLDACEDLSGGDFNADGSFTEADFDALADCLAGPGQPPAAEPMACAATCLAAFDLDADADVDLADFARLAELFNP